MAGRYKRNSLMGMTEQQIKARQREQQIEWSKKLEDDAFADDVVDEPTHARYDRKPTDMGGGGSSLG